MQRPLPNPFGRRCDDAGCCEIMRNTHIQLSRHWQNWTWAGSREQRGLEIARGFLLEAKALPDGIGPRRRSFQLRFFMF